MLVIPERERLSACRSNAQVRQQSRPRPPQGQVPSADMLECWDLHAVVGGGGGGPAGQMEAMITRFREGRTPPSAAQTLTPQASQPTETLAGGTWLATGSHLRPWPQGVHRSGDKMVGYGGADDLRACFIRQDGMAFQLPGQAGVLTPPP